MNVNTGMQPVLALIIQFDNYEEKIWTRTELYVIFEILKVREVGFSRNVFQILSKKGFEQQSQTFIYGNSC